MPRPRERGLWFWRSAIGVMLMSVVGLFSVAAFNSAPALDPETECRMDRRDPAHTLLLIDQSDPFSDNDLAWVDELIDAEARSLPRFGRLTVVLPNSETPFDPTTLYAHFAGKTEILMLLWADVLSEMEAHVRDKIQDKTNTADSLAAATYAFVTYWRDHPDDFRLVFMSSNVGKTDVDSFIKAGNVDRGFAIFKDLLRAHDPGAVDADIDIRSETLVAGMIGVALCLNTISGYAWPSVSRMTDQLLAGILAS